MSDELGRRLEERLAREAGARDGDLGWVLDRGRRLRGRRTAFTATAAIAVVAVAWTVVAGGLVRAPDPQVVGPGPEGEEVVELTPLADLTVNIDDRAGGVSAPTLTVRSSDDAFDTAVVAFDRPEISLDCVEKAALRLYLSSAEGGGDESLSLYASSIFTAADLDDGDVVKEYGRVLDTRPKAEALIGTQPGWIEFDVTDIYRLWISGKPFPSLGAKVPNDTPIVFVLRFTQLAQHRSQEPLIRSFSSSESMDPPVLSLNPEKGCEGGRGKEPGPIETHGGYVVGSKEVVMAFGRDGDIWLALSDGSVVNITQSPEAESSPTISFDDKVLVYERQGKRYQGTLVYHRLDTGESAEFADGYSPAFGPLDYLAWDSGRGEVVVGSPFSDWSVRAPNGPGGEGATSYGFAWDQSLELLYYSVAFGHGVDPYYIDIQRVDGWECSECGGGLKLGKVRSLQPDDGTEGEFISTSFGTSVDVLRVCCTDGDNDPWNDDPWETAEIGGLDPFDTGTLYNRIRGLDDVPLDLSGPYLRLAHAGSLEATVEGDDVKWRVTDRMAWFLINGSNLWLLTDGRDPVLLPFEVEHGSVAVAPTFARSPLIHSF